MAPCRLLCSSGRTCPATKLKKCALEINPYDFCVANKTIDNKQCTVVWHVDDLKISHVNPVVVTVDNL
jgi:hypothetical protein